MILSMTAFARESASTPVGTLTVELRSVNHRYLDCSFKLPDTLRALEPALRESAAAALARGKLDCLFRLQHEAQQNSELIVDDNRLEGLLAAAKQVATRLDQPADINPLEILLFPGVLQAATTDEDALYATAKELFTQALRSLTQTREREGEKLAAMIQERLTQISEQVAITRETLPQLQQHQRDKLTAKLAQLDTDADEGRLEQELVYLAQKADVCEELDRLDAHVSEVQRTLHKGGPCGRRLDFLMQELNREANTLSSKSISAGTTTTAVDLKVLIEQMREQIQNIE